MRSQDIAAYYTIHHEISGHCCILYNTPRDLKTRLHIIHYTTRSEDIAAYYKYTPRDLKKLLHIIQYTTRSQDIAAYYTIHHEISIHCCILYDTPRDLKTLLHIIQYTTSSQDTVTHSDSQCLSKLRCNVHLKRELRGALHKCRNWLRISVCYAYCSVYAGTQLCTYVCRDNIYLVNYFIQRCC